MYLIFNFFIVTIFAIIIKTFNFSVILIAILIIYFMILILKFRLIIFFGFLIWFIVFLEFLYFLDTIIPQYIDANLYLTKETTKCYVFQYLWFYILINKDNFSSHLNIGNIYHISGHLLHIKGKFSNRQYNYFLISVNASRSYWTPICFFNDIRRWFSSNLHGNKFLEQLLLGKFNNNLYSKMSLLNINFLFCVSGLHIIGFLKIFKKFKNKYLKTFIWIFLIFYLFVLNFSVPYERALFYYLIIKIKKRFKFKILNLDLLSLTGLIIIFFHFQTIFSFSFIFSYVYSFFIQFFLYEKEFQNSLVRKIVFLIFIQILNIIMMFWINSSYCLLNIIYFPILLFLTETLFNIGIFSLFLSPLYHITTLISNFYIYLINIFSKHVYSIYFNINNLQWILFLFLFFVIILMYNNFVGRQHKKV